MGYKTSERLNVYSAWKIGTSFTKKVSQMSLMNTDKDSLKENAQKIDFLTNNVSVLVQ